MLTIDEYYLQYLAEECVEVAQRVSKAIRFGITEIQPGQDMNNAIRLTAEMADVFGVWEVLVERGLVPKVTGAQIDRKLERMAKYLKFSQDLGTVEGPAPSVNGAGLGEEGRQGVSGLDDKI